MWVKVRITCYSRDTGETSRADSFEFTGQSAAWKPAADSCCYYTQALKPDEKTGPLFKSLKDILEEDDILSCLTVSVALAAEGDDVRTARGWR